MAKNGFSIERRFLHRNDVFNAVIEEVYDQEVLYLEFGVHKGASMKYWAQALQHPERKLHGFDSFEGLPEDWDLDPLMKRGTFDVKGQTPKINDSRVSFFKGWFHEVLPKYNMPKHSILIIIMDADLYSSTKYVLNYLRPFIKERTYIYFDNMSRPNHEPRAFKEFMDENSFNFRLIAADKSLNNAFFERV